MPLHRFEPHQSAITWSASGSISQELAPKPYTITRMGIVVRLTSVTTTTVTNLNDAYDRVISRLTLSGKGKTYFDFTNLRAAYHLSRFAGFAPKRPSIIPDSSTTVAMYFAYIFHFGVAPFRVNPLTGMLEDNPFDLTGGIPISEAGNLTLQGTWGAAAAMGTNNTINAAAADVYLWGVQPKPGDPAALWMPRAFPIWQMQTPTPTATSGAFATQHNVPAGDFLHSILGMATNGTGAPRDDSVLNSLSIYNQLESREVMRFGIGSGVVGDVKAAELLMQNGLYRLAPPSDNVTTAMTAIASGGTPGVIAVTQPSDAGLYHLPLHEFARAGGGHPLYGVDLRRVATGDLQLRYGVSDATGVTLDFLYRKYQLNPEHPANAGA